MYYAEKGMHACMYVLCECFSVTYTLPWWIFTEDLAQVRIPQRLTPKLHPDHYICLESIHTPHPINAAIQ